MGRASVVHPLALSGESACPFWHEVWVCGGGTVDSMCTSVRSLPAGKRVFARGVGAVRAVGQSAGRRVVRQRTEWGAVASSGVAVRVRPVAVSLFFPSSFVLASSVHEGVTNRQFKQVAMSSRQATTNVADPNKILVAASARCSGWLQGGGSRIENGGGEACAANRGTCAR